MMEATNVSEAEWNVVNKEDMKEHFHFLGIQRGMTLYVDANTLHMPWMSGGVQTIIDALMETIGYEGTLIMPAFTLNLLDPATNNPSIVREQWGKYREGMLPFDSKLSISNQSDELVKQFLRNEGVVRSGHPLYSFAAWGKYAKAICDQHPLHFSLSKDSPLGKIQELNGYVLLFGANYEECIWMHLARYNGNKLPIQLQYAPILKHQKTEWKGMLELVFSNEGYQEVGMAMEERKIVKQTYIQNKVCRFFLGKEAISLVTAYDHL